MAGESRSRLKHRKRLLFLLGLGFLTSVLIIFRSAQFQIFKDPRLASLSKRQFHSRVLIRPRRGMIVDRNNEPLAVSLEVQSLAANPTKIKLKEIQIEKLARFLEISKKRLRNRLKSGKTFVWMKRHLSEIKVKNLARSGITDSQGQLKDGFWLVRESKRVYPNGRVAGQVLGQANIDLMGIDGLEYYFNDLLKGRITSIEATRDGLRRPTFIDAGKAKHVEDGKSLKLTLDSTLQFEVERILNEHRKRTQSKSGTVLIMDAESGEILVMANAPFFDPNTSKVNARLRRNRLVTDGYEPGSTMKPVLVAIALENGKKIDDVIWAGMGKTKIQGRWISEAEAKEQFGWINLERLIQVSSNVASAHLALELGQEKFLRHLKKLGLGNQTHVEFPGEISGWLPRKSKIPNITLANLGFGQGIMATRIQMARIYASFLNGGFLIRPKLVIDSKPQFNDSLTRVWSSTTSHSITQALTKVTQEGGTGTEAAVPGFTVAGKTGTAQTVDSETKRYSRERYITSFIGYPVNTEKKLVILTSLDHPKGNYYASATSAPLFRDVLVAVINRYGLKAKPELVQIQKDHILTSSAMRSLKDFLKKDQKNGIETGRKFQVEKLNDDERKINQSWIMPSLKGLSPREVTRVLRGHNFDLKLEGFGTVVSQAPEKGQLVNDGTEIYVELDATPLEGE